MTLSELMPNEGKMDVMEVDGVAWLRLPIKTHVITEKDDIVAVRDPLPQLFDLVHPAPPRRIF